MSVKLFTVVLGLAITSPLLAETTAESSVVKDTIACSIEELWQKTLNYHLLLKSKQNEVEIAKAALKQEKLWDNPQVSFSHNVNNPVTHRYFETNKDGETDIQISQRIYIAGQRGERIHVANEEWHRTKYEQKDLERLLCRDLSKQMIQLFSLQQKGKVVEDEIESMNQILQAYDEQKEKGNISKIEIMRISGMRLQLLQEMANLLAEMTSLQQSIKLMSGLDSETKIFPVIDYAKTVLSLSRTGLAEIKMNLDDRVDMLAGKHDILSAEHLVRLQKANAFPEVNLTGEWDKNGNIGRNYFAIGVSFSLPLFNRNQGNIKSAKVALHSKRILQSWNLQQAGSEIDALWEKIQMNLNIIREAEKHQSLEKERMFDVIRRQYMKRNISLLELLDYYQTYKNTHFLIIDSKQEVLLGMADMDLKIQ